MRATISAAGTTSSSRQPFVWPTSMYSMKRRTWPLPRKRSASATIPSSFTPRLTTALTFTGSPAAAAASIPSSTRSTGKSTSLSARKVASSTESRLTVTRSRPARASASAFCASSAPFVVSASSSSGIAASSSTRCSTLRRTSGSPPVMRTVRTPSPAKTPTTRAISSRLSSSRRSRKACSRPKTSFGMQ